MNRADDVAMDGHRPPTGHSGVIGVPEAWHIRLGDRRRGWYDVLRVVRPVVIGECLARDSTEGRLALLRNTMGQLDRTQVEEIWTAADAVDR